MPAFTPEHWAMIVAAFAGAFGVVGGAALGFLAAWLKARSDKNLAVANLAAQQAVTKAQIDKQIDQRLAAEVNRLNGELDDVRRDQADLTALFSQWKAAVARVFHAIASQWTGDGGPDIDPADIALLEDTIPLRWMRPRRRATTTTTPIDTVPKE